MNHNYLKLSQKEKDIANQLAIKEFQKKIHQRVSIEKIYMRATNSFNNNKLIHEKWFHKHWLKVLSEANRIKSVISHEKLELKNQ